MRYFILTIFLAVLSLDGFAQDWFSSYNYGTYRTSFVHLKDYYKRYRYEQRPSAPSRPNIMIARLGISDEGMVRDYKTIAIPYIESDQRSWSYSPYRVFTRTPMETFLTSNDGNILFFVKNDKGFLKRHALYFPSKSYFEGEILRRTSKIVRSSAIKLFYTENCQKDLHLRYEDKVTKLKVLFDDLKDLEARLVILAKEKGR